jgi:hypothetical protein
MLGEYLKSRDVISYFRTVLQMPGQFLKFQDGASNARRVLQIPLGN